MDEIVKKFWDKWIVADELERERLTGTLTLGEASAGIVNSYFEDLEEYLKGVR